MPKSGKGHLLGSRTGSRLIGRLLLFQSINVPVKFLQITQIARQQIFNPPRVNLFQSSQLGNHARQNNLLRISLIFLPLGAGNGTISSIPRDSRIIPCRCRLPYSSRYPLGRVNSNSVWSIRTRFLLLIIAPQKRYPHQRRRYQQWCGKSAKPLQIKTDLLDCLTGGRFPN